MNKSIIVGVPRTASKMVIQNFMQYMIAKYGVVYNLNEYLNHAATNHFTVQSILHDGQPISTQHPIISADTELKNRIRIFKDLYIPCVMKYFPIAPYIELTDSVLNHASTVVYLGRSDVFDHALSICISLVTDCWSSGEQQATIIAGVVKNKYTISETLFTNVLHSLHKYNVIYCSGKKVHDFSSLVSMKTSKDFCEEFDLSFVDFEFTNNDIEYGDRKLDMISNISALHDIYLERIKRG